MAGTSIVTEIVGILVSGLQAMGTGLGQGISNFVTALAFTGTGSDQTLSPYFVMVIVFAAIGLSVGLLTRVFLWLTSLGN